MSDEIKSEYEKLKNMHYQMYLLEKNGIQIKSKWQKSKQLIKNAILSLPESEAALKEALTLARISLSAKQMEDENPPLKKIALDSMNGCPVWVVSYDHDGRWGIVDSNSQSVLLPTAEDVDEIFWFDGNYIFRYRKEIRDYSELLKKHNIAGEE